MELCSGLLKAGADGDNVALLDEGLISISLNDEKIRRAIADFYAGHVVTVVLMSRISG